MRKLFCTPIIIALIFGLSACGSQTPEQVVSAGLDAVKNIDKETVVKYFDSDALLEPGKSDDDVVQSQEELHYFVDKLEYRILSSTKDGDSAIVKTEITNIDMKPILQEMLRNVITEAFANAFSNTETDDVKTQEKYEKLFVDLIKNEDNKKITTTVDIQLSKSDGSWRIKLDDKLEDAIFGGLVSARKEISEGFGGETGSTKSRLREISNYVIADLWNSGFCNVDSYIKTGKSSTGSTMDIDLTLQRFENAISKKAEYNTYINSLQGNDYSMLKQVWGKLSAETDNLYSQIKAKKPTANDSTYSFDTGLFNQYMSAFSDEINKLGD